MTAPSLLDELEGVVRLAEKATPGPWLYRSKSNSWHKPPQQGTVYSYGEHIVGMDSDDEADNGWDEAFLIAAVQFMTAHHAELADMAKRLEAAERDSKRLDWLSDPNQCSGQVLLPTASVEANLHDMRAAIDHAMDAAIDAAQEGEG